MYNVCNALSRQLQEFAYRSHVQCRRNFKAYTDAQDKLKSMYNIIKH